MKRFVGIVLACFVLAAEAGAAERILRFHSDIDVRADGAVVVEETIRVRAEGNQIRRGIYRDIPTDYRDALGNRVRVGFRLAAVERDGNPEPHHTQRLANGTRIYAGAREVFLSPGEYEYRLRYRLDRMLGFFDDHDELYFNVTGNGWSFPIDAASATVSLPDSVPAGEVRVEGYTGAFGSQGSAYRADVNAAGDAYIETTAALPPRHGLTLVVSWPKGHVSEPTALDDATFLLRDNIGLAIVLAAALVSLFYLFMTWRRIGKDPPPGVIFPHYEPPDGYSPASIRYISKLGYDKRAFTTAILNLAVKGYLQIERDGKRYTLRRTKDAKRDDMAPGESALYSKLFAGRDSLVLENDNHAVVRDAMEAHERTLKGYHHQQYFVTNGLFLLPSILILLAALLATAMLDALTLSVGIVVVVSMAVISLFAYLLKAPTLLGRKLLDRVEGFKMYLEVAEKDDLDLRNPPEQTPELFEAYLPYALALGVEQPWAEQFADVFRRIRDEDGRDYHPAWYATYDFDPVNPVRFADSVGDSLNSAISSASRAPGSSSGGGGGGFSGGGGGGGGGGGW